MALYDLFLENHHPEFIKKYLIASNRNIIKYLLNKIKRNNISILEIWPWKWYFYAAVKKHPLIKYSALDRNALILSNLPENIDKYYGELPNIPNNIVDKKFDIIYCAYVMEHLNNWETIYMFMKEYKNLLNDWWYLVILTPDCLRQKWEFFNMDYTHKYPTTKRNIYMILKDVWYQHTEIYELNWILYPKYFYSRFFNFMHKLLLSIISYKFLDFFFWVFLNKKIYDTDNIFYKMYCLIKQENIIFISQKKWNEKS